MNQKAKAVLRQLSADGLFKDARLWSEEDWMDLHFAVQTAIERISKRHRERVKEGQHAE